MKYVVFCALLLAGVGFAVAARAGTAVVTLRPSAEVPGTRYVLGDIADIESADGELKRRLGALPVGAVPRQGYTESVPRADVEAVVRSQVASQAVEWRGAASIRIRGRGQRVDAEKLTDAAASALYTVLAKDFKSIEMQPVATEGINVPAGALRLSARVPAAQLAARRMSALVDVNIDGHVYTTVPVWFAVHASRPALLARNALRQNDALRGEDFETRMVDVASGTATALPGDTPLDGMRLKRPLEAGAALSTAHVEPKPAVARDEQVTVRVVSGAVTIETTGRAMADARVGDTIKVKSTSTNESYSARVVGEGVVLVSAR